MKLATLLCAACVLAVAGSADAGQKSASLVIDNTTPFPVAITLTPDGGTSPQTVQLLSPFTFELDGPGTYTVEASIVNPVGVAGQPISVTIANGESATVAVGFGVQGGTVVPVLTEVTASSSMLRESIVLLASLGGLGGIAGAGRAFGKSRRSTNDSNDDNQAA